jgi:hypothetical protein
MLTPEAKKLLAETIRGTAQSPEKGLRERLLHDIRLEAERRYRLSVPLADAGLDEAHRMQRGRLEAWLAERARSTKPKSKAETKAAEERFFAQAVKEAAATFLNRLVLLRHLEAKKGLSKGLSKPVVLTGGQNSAGYREFRAFAPALLQDDTEGYGALLQLVFGELAIDLPGLFGDVGLTALFPIPAGALREVVERLDVPGLASAWTDDTTLGWVYQYWNDPDREALDAKINGGGKIQPHEIASKTQMFTERYMVEWLLQNSLGLTWLSMCKRHGWTPDAERVLPELDARRAAWRTRREAGEVALDALMPIEGQLEEHWKYYVPQPIPDDAVANAPGSVRALKILDPACGSGHFLVIAFDLLAALYREESRHTGVALTDAQIAESILENNLHGIDIDPRAIQIAAAGVYLKAKSFARTARPRTVNLVAPALGLGNLPADDPAVVRLRTDLAREAGIPAELTDRLLTSLAGVDYLGSLFKVDHAIDEAIFASARGQKPGAQLSLGAAAAPTPTRKTGESGELRLALLDKLEHFLAQHSSAVDLGLRLDGEQLAAGVRFVRMAREGTYDIVVGNPPYQGISKTASFEYVAKNYPRGKADLCTAFLERSLDLSRQGGISALVTMRAWMFLGQFTELRTALLRERDLRVIGDLDKGAFESMTTSQLISVAMTIFRASPPSQLEAVALQPTAPGEKYWGPDRTDLKRAAMLAHRGRYEFDPRGFEVIEGEPIVYWWSKEFLEHYGATPKLGEVAPIRVGLQASDNQRFLRFVWEVSARNWRDQSRATDGWVPYIKGAAGRAWVEPLTFIVNWRHIGLEVRTSDKSVVRNDGYYFRVGVAFPRVGSVFAARIHRYESIFDTEGASVFATNADVLCLLNSSYTKRVISSLNPTIHFQVSDVARVPLVTDSLSDEILSRVNNSFSSHESKREASPEFRRPSDSDWAYTQTWAQEAVDRVSGDSLPRFNSMAVPATSSEQVSFAIGVALRRFDRDGAGPLNPTPNECGIESIIFASSDERISIYGPGGVLVDAWTDHGPTISPGDDLSTYLRKSFFDYHRKLYENRPIYFPLSSAKKSFVAYVSIHRWQDDTLNVVLADHLVPARRRLEGELEDLRTARAAPAAGPANRNRTERRFTEVQKLLEELNDFIAKVTEVAEKGAPPVDDKTPRREVDARYVMDLDDGVLVNSAALWPLLEPQWKDPKKWWKELASASGKKDYDWSHLAARYFPDRVRAKCVTDPSLAVAHKCFWELHPAKAYAWELRLQDEIRAGFTIDEPASDASRAAFLANRATEAAEIAAKEQSRRAKKAAKAAAGADGGDGGDDEDAGPLFEGEAEAETGETTDA